MRVKCIECEDVGYTASPDYVRCKCGGKLMVIQENQKEIEVEHENYAHIK